MIETSNPVALITGASRGLGLEIARLFAARGFDLILTARGPEALSDVERELSASTGVLALAGDVADSEHTLSLIEQGIARFGRIDVLINNASELGPSPLPALENYPIDVLQTVFAVNVLAPVHLTQLVLPDMRRHGHGTIINVTSDAGVEAYPTWGGYGASKAALEHLSRVMAAELDGSGIRVYVVDPGDMDTAMHRAAEPGVDLSHLPPPVFSAPAFLWLVEEETAPFGRYAAQELVVERRAAHART